MKQSGQFSALKQISFQKTDESNIELNIKSNSDNYIKIKSNGTSDLINTIQNVDLLDNDGRYVYGAIA